MSAEDVAAVSAEFTVTKAAWERQYERARDAEAEVERLTTALAEAAKPCRHMELPDTQWSRLATAERDVRNLSQDKETLSALAARLHAERDVARQALGDLRERVEALAVEWERLTGSNRSPAAKVRLWCVEDLRELLAEGGA